MTHKNPIQIIYEDDALIIVNKRSGILSVPAPDAKEKDLGFLLNRQMQRDNALPCHRLDKETSGVIVFAKGRNNQQIIMDQFRQRKIKKTYIAFVHGCIKRAKGVIKSNIQGAWPYRRCQMSKLAVTNFKLIFSSDDFSVMRLEPVTGRTNQIRIQFRDYGHPLVGERRFVYAKDWPVKFKRAALHSYSIEINHPQSQERMKFCTPMPEDMKCFLKTHEIANILINQFFL
ncbi:MAG: RluA family pseudouridine synthase [Candidatus Omnitrophica bacterium]|nr:RluA family pseudouridine synthase [Candidatus Omnitrophota bacterium]